MSDDTRTSEGEDSTSPLGTQPTKSESSPSEGIPTATKSGLRSLRVWPAVILLGVMALLRSLPALIENGPAGLWMSAAFGPLLAGFCVLLWWLMLSRASWKERVVGFLGVVAFAAITIALIDPTMRGPAVMVLTIPLGTAGFALGAIAMGRFLSFRRTFVALLVSLLGFGSTLLLRSDGMWGNFNMGLHWRWIPSPEEVLLVDKQNAEDAPVLYSEEEVRAWLQSPEWPGFRGVDRTGQQIGVVFSSDWEADPPEELWRVPVGPGWSSYAVAGKQLFTQEQRGKQECIVCYDADSGKEIWVQSIESRFDDPLGGPGPRATPTLGDNAVFALGAQGWLTRLDPRTGEIEWKLDLREVAQRDPPMWGFCSSPLLVDDLVVIYAGGKGEKGTLAFDAKTGELRWGSKAGNHSYSSAQLVEIDGGQYILMLTNTGVDVLNPKDGSAKLRYAWESGGYRSVQPQLTQEDALVLPTGAGVGTRLVSLETEEDDWSTDEVWESLNLKPDFNDYVIHEGHLYGFDDTIFTSINLENGDRNWKRGRYGKGQVLLLKDSGLLLVAGERGQLVLLEANPEKHVEIAEIDALEGRTWNHPVVVGDRLYLRNSQESVCYRLPVIDAPTENE